DKFGRSLLKQPQKIMRLIVDEEAKLTHEFFRDRVKGCVDEIGHTMERIPKQHTKIDNVYKKLNRMSNMK
ncbi:unnamed protein product, partial [Amoebophrya sp. A120]